jgi:hypothetical protein
MMRHGREWSQRHHGAVIDKTLFYEFLPGMQARGLKKTDFFGHMINND